MIKKRKPRPLTDTIKFRFIRGDYERYLGKIKCPMDRFIFERYIASLLEKYGAILGTHYNVEYGKNSNRKKDIIIDYIVTDELLKRFIKDFSARKGAKQWVNLQQA